MSVQQKLRPLKLLFHFHRNVFVLVFNFPIYCFLRDNSPKTAITNWINVFTKFMITETVLYISVLEYISDACSETIINYRHAETIHSRN